MPTQSKKVQKKSLKPAFRAKTKAKGSTTFRSQFENTVATYLTRLGIEFGYETVNIHYVKKHTYKVDFILPNGIYVETKGYFTASDRAKHLEVKKANPELDIRFLFMHDNKLHKLSDTRYSDWCDKNGFKYAFSPAGQIPLSWLKEDNVSQVNKKKVKSKDNS